MQAEKNNLKKYVRSIPQCFLAVATLFSVFGVFYYTIGLSKNFVNTDIFDTLLWAKASYESGKIFAPDFCYSAFLPFGGSLLMLPFIKFFGVSFTTHVIGMVLFEIIFLVSFVIFFKKIGFNANWIMFALIANCGLWMCSDKFREMFMEHIIYYSLSALFILIGYTIISSLIENLKSSERKKQSIVLGVAAFVFFTLVATDGFQIVGLATVPVIAAVVCERFFDLKTKLFSKDNKAEIIAVMLVGVATIAGLMIIKKLLNGNVSEYASSFSQYDTNDHIYMYPSKIKSFIDCWYRLFEVFFISGTALTNTAQIPTLISAVFATVLLATVPVTALFYKKLKSEHNKRIFWIAFFVFAVMIALWVLSTVSGINWSNNIGVEWRLIPAVYASFLLLIADLRLLFEHVITRRFSVIIILIMIMSMYPSVNYFLAYTPTDNNAGYSELIEKIDNYGITEGYGNYWIAGTLNVITKERINTVFTIYRTDEIIHIYNYQQFPYKHNSTSKNTFLIIKRDQVVFFEESDGYKKHKDNLLEKYETGGQFGYVVYFYDCDIYGTIIQD